MTIVLSPNDFIATRAVSGRELASELFVSVHDRLTEAFAALDGAGSFEEERWARAGGGGGVSRLLVDGALFEKAGINRSAVEGVLPTEAATRLGGRVPPNGPAMFFAA